MPDAAPRVLILCSDLIFSTKITGTAKALNQPFAVARTLEKLAQILDATATGPGEPPAGPTLIIDLNITSVDPIAAVKLAAAHPAAPRITAFLSHVQVDLAAAAKLAGAHHVLARSAFVQRLPALLGGTEPPP